MLIETHRDEKCEEKRIKFVRDMPSVKYNQNSNVNFIKLAS